MTTKLSVKVKMKISKTSIITAPPITEQVVELLRDSILRGEYGPGAKINEVELSERIKVSRSPIREAIQRLSKEGIIRLIPHKGAFANVPNTIEISELFEVREPLEVLAAGLAAKRASVQQLNQLTEYLKKTEAAIGENAYEKYPWDLDFHRQIAKFSNNSILENQISEINVKLQLVRFFSGTGVGRASQALAEHEAIVNAMKKQDINLAKRMMKLHIFRSRKNIFTYTMAEAN